MKKLFLLILLLFAAQLQSQYYWTEIGNTRIADSTGYTTFNRNLKINGNTFITGYITFDTLSKGRLEYTGQDIQMTNEKVSGGYVFWMGDKLPQFQINMLIEDFPGYIPLVTIDSTGVDLGAEGMQYKINGTPISGSGGSDANLFGYFHKDTIFTANQHVKFKRFTLWGSGTDSVQFTVKGGTGDYMVTPVGTSVTFGSTFGTGSKDVYAGAYYIGDTILSGKTLTWTRQNKFTSDTTIVKSLKGLTGEGWLYLRSPGDGNQRIALGNTATSSTILIQPSSGAGYSYVFDNTGFTTSDAKMNWSTSSFGFSSDPDSYFKRNAADDVGIYTGGAQRLQISNSLITSNTGFVISGNSSYLKVPNLTEAQRDALTPSAGMIIYNTDVSTLQVYSGGAWVGLH